MAPGRRQPRTVLFLHGSSGGYGADRQLGLLAAGLDPDRYRPLVVLPEPGPLGARLEAAGVEVVTARLAVLRRELLRGRGAASTGLLLRRNVRELGELARRRRAAIVHTNSSLLLCGQGVAQRAVAAHVLHVREIYAGETPGARALWPVLRRRFLRADAILCVSEAAAAQFGSAERVAVLADGLTRERSRNARDDARRALGLDPRAFVVATIGRISDWKGQHVLLRALADPLLAEIGAVGVVAGDASPHQRHFELELAALAAQLELDGRVRFLGFRDDVDVLLAAADAVAVPSTYPDSLPNAAIEAAAAGRPVVATDTGGQREIVRDGVTGRLVRPHDSEALARALRELANDPGAAARLGGSAAADAAERFRAERVLAELQDAYDRLLEGRGGPRAWLLPVKPLPVSQPAAPELRMARLASWLEEEGYRPVVLGRGLRSLPALVVRAIRERPGLVLAAAAVYAPALAVLKRVLRGRVLIVSDVIGLHSLEVEQALPRPWLRTLVRPAWRAFERAFVGVADVVLAVNAGHASYVRRRDRPGGVTVLRDAAEVELAGIRPLERSTLGVPEQATLIGFVGSLVYGRLDPLLATLERCAAGDGPPLALVVAGDGPDLERYRARAAGAGLLGRTVFFLGGLPRRDALAALRACDIAYSDCWSGLGLPAKLFEYMALGLPIVTRATPQAAEVLEEGVSALFYRSEQELARALLELAAAPALRARLGVAAREAFLERHTVERRGQEFAAILAGRAPGLPPSAAGRAGPELVSVVMPIRDEAEVVAEQLAALAAQEYAGAWELVVVDDGCTDSSLTIVESFRGRLPAVRVAQAGRGLNHARNTGAAEARGSLLAFCDADDVVAPGWLAALVVAARGADLVGGPLELESLNDETTRAWRPGEVLSDLPVAHGFLPYVPGGNCAIWAEVAREVGWDESFRFGSSDTEFAWRAQLAGHRLAFAPGAVVSQRYRRELAATLRQHVAYGSSAAHLYRRYRRHGMTSAGARGGIRVWKSLLRTAPDLLRSPARRGSWLRLAAVCAGRLLGSLRWRVLFP